MTKETDRGKTGASRDNDHFKDERKKSIGALATELSSAYELTPGEEGAQRRIAILSEMDRRIDEEKIEVAGLLFKSSPAVQKRYEAYGDYLNSLQKDVKRDLAFEIAIQPAHYQTDSVYTMLSNRLSKLFNFSRQTDRQNQKQKLLINHQ